MMNLTVVLSARISTLKQSVLDASNADFPIGNVDNLFIAEEHLQALSACHRAVVTKAVCQGAAMALATA